MQVIKADVLGMCFGVRDALKLIDSVSQPRDVTIHGELVHNEEVLKRLDARGFRQVEERRRRELPLTNTVLVTAHGISDRERARLLQAGKRLLDSTCPLVTRAHDAARKLQADGYHVLVIGRRGHVEVQGIVEDLDSFDILETPHEVAVYPHPRLGVMCQTTTPLAHATAVREAIARRNPHADIRFVDTICHPTKDHQESLERLLDKVEVVVVVGGQHSNNTKQLVRRCLERDVPAHHVQSADDLRAEWFEGVERVGLTAGTSTLEETITEVFEALAAMGGEHEMTAESPRRSREWAVLGSNQ